MKIYITEISAVEPSHKNPTHNEFYFSLSSSPPTGWKNPLTQIPYRYHIEVRGNNIMVVFPSNQEFGQQQLDELKDLVTSLNKHYRHFLEQAEKISEDQRQLAQKQKEQRESIKSKITKLNFDK